MRRLLTVMAAAVLACGVFACTVQPAYAPPVAAQTSTHQSLATERVKDVVGVKVGEAGYCSGVIINSTTIVTNAHCAETPTTDIKFYNGAVVTGTFVYVNKEADLALVSIPDVGHGRYTTLRCSTWVGLGEEIFVVGHPYGLAWSVHFGRVSGLDRDVLTTKNAIQIDVSMGPGQSGGALFDMRGDLVGITFAGLNGTGGSFNFAIPVSTLCNILNKYQQ